MSRPNLTPLTRGIGLGVRLGRQVGIDPQGDGGDLAHALGDFAE